MKSSNCIVILGAIVGSFLLSSCARDLNEQQAKKQIEEHVHSVAPNVLKSLNIEIIEILSPDENNREVRFREQHKLVPPEGVQDKTKTTKMSPTIYSVYFQKSARGWTLRKYGHGTGSLVNLLRIEQWGRDYQQLTSPLLEILLALPSVADSRELNEDRIKAIIAKKNITLPSDIVWGFTPGKYELQPGVLWVRESSNPKKICAQAIGFKGESDYLPNEFLWLSRMNSSTLSCIGGVYEVNVADMLDEENSIISKYDGLFPPYKKE